jgi:hypothetical protein
MKTQTDRVHRTEASPDEEFQKICGHAGHLYALEWEGPPHSFTRCWLTSGGSGVSFKEPQSFSWHLVSGMKLLRWISWGCSRSTNEEHYLARLRIEVVESARIISRGWSGTGGDGFK